MLDVLWEFDVFLVLHEGRERAYETAEWCCDQHHLRQLRRQLHELSNQTLGKKVNAYTRLLKSLCDLIVGYAIEPEEDVDEDVWWK